MRKCRVLDIILSAITDRTVQETQKMMTDNSDCGGFLCQCDGSCNSIFNSSSLLQPIHYFDVVMSSTEILLYVGDEDDLTEILLKTITKCPNWQNCFEKKHVSSRNRYFLCRNCGISICWNRAFGKLNNNFISHLRHTYERFNLKL